MFHPLAEDPKKLKDQVLEAKIFDLTKKYHIAARFGQSGVCNQIAIALEMYKVEQYKRQQALISEGIKKQNSDIDGLINID
jgi:hypothetical protein